VTTQPDDSHPSRRETLSIAGGLAAGVILASSPVRGEEDAKNGKPVRPAVIAFDVIETLFDLKPVAARLKEAGLPADALGEWFARLLRDATALTLTGVYKPFPEVARGTLAVMLTAAGVKPTADRLDAVLAGFGELPAHPDVAPAFARLRDAKMRVVTLTNGTADATRKLLKRAEIDGMVERVITVDDVKKWKPAKEMYLHAAEVLKVPPARLALVAAHDWDCHGAGRAGLTSGFVARGLAAYHPAMDPPAVKGKTLKEVVDALLELPEK